MRLYCAITSVRAKAEVVVERKVGAIQLCCEPLLPFFFFEGEGWREEEPGYCSYTWSLRCNKTKESDSTEQDADKQTAEAQRPPPSRSL